MERVEHLGLFSDVIDEFVRGSLHEWRDYWLFISYTLDLPRTFAVGAVHGLVTNGLSHGCLWNAMSWFDRISHCATRRYSFSSLI